MILAIPSSEGRLLMPHSTCVSRTGIFHVLFTFIFKTHNLYFVQVFTLKANLCSLLSILPSNFVSDHQENEERSVLKS